MIRHLRVRNLATIEDLEIRFGPGFSVLTGETGAGKSILIDSLRLIGGEKASADLIRTGCREAVVEALLTRPAGVAAPLADPEAEEMSVQRVVAEEGAAKAYCDGVLVPLKRLRDLVSGLIDVYGQNDHVFLLRLESHLDYLDQQAGTLALRAEAAALAAELRAQWQKRLDWRAKERDRRQRLDYLEYQIQELEKAALRPGEEDELRAERHRLRNAEKIGGLLDKALGLAYSGEPSLSELAVKLQAALDELAAFDAAFTEYRDALGPAVIAAREAADFLMRYKDGQDVAPERLETIEERLSRIESLKRKYGGQLEDVQARLDELVAERDDLVRIQDRLAEADREIARLHAAYAEKAARLSKRRQAAAAELGGAIEQEIGMLGMKKARFEVRVSPQPVSPENAVAVRDSGWDDVEFLISPNPGEDLKPLRRIASGGELSRIMLALKSAGQAREGAPTLIFDEIDAGIGGRTADFVAQKLRRLARAHQVICITHLPQIASHADHHFRIDKRIEKDRTFTTVRALQGEERVEEIARLMTGSRITEAARASAREMLRPDGRD
jgi:DNA repair protein RecN (Recombination protein N)